ncbi:helix-turn-helix domain-containing protein [Bradyrhizobium sp. 18]|nr:helix-turn-helix domain-containing protein [Bradyrhizobium sp. 18]
MRSKELIALAIARAGGSEAKLARHLQLSQPLINKAKRTGRVGPKLALAIHHFSNGEIPASAIRPDLWERPEDVPGQKDRAA